MDMMMSSSVLNEVLENDFLKEGLSVTIRDAFGEIVHGKTVECFFEIEDNELTICYKKNSDDDEEYWAYFSQIKSLNGKPFSFYKSHLEKHFQ